MTTTSALLTAVSATTERSFVLSRLPFAKGSTFDSYKESEGLDTQCLPGTRVELLQDIREWAEQSESKLMFWLNGAAGTGKSTIARTISAELASQGRLGASFFFKKGEADCSNASLFFSSVIAQLMKAIPSLVPYIESTIEDDPQIADKALREQFERLILHPLSAIQADLEIPVVLVIDALDECNSDVQIRLLLQELSRLRVLSNLVRIFLTSRPELAARDGFERMTRISYQDFILHDISSSLIDRDIMLFLVYKLDQIQKQSSNQLRSDWPDQYKIESLLLLVRPLFICAATICRFISEPYDDPDVRLRYVLRIRDTEVYDPVHQTYQLILEKLIRGSTARHRVAILKEFREVVGAIVILSELLPITALASILGIEPRQIQIRLKGLHSVINISTNPRAPLRIFHKSFADFLLDEARAGSHNFCIENRTVHRELGLKCLGLLINTPCLKQDICGLRHPATFRETVDLHLVSECLPSHVQYACRYWVHHCKAGLLKLSEHEDMVADFLRGRFLYWFEAPSLIGQADQLIKIVFDLQDMADPDMNSSMFTFLSDAQRFVLANAQVANLAPLQLYSSSILFAPECSVIKATYEHLLPAWITRRPIVAGTWSSTLQSMENFEYNDTVMSFSLSTDGKLLAFGTRDNEVKLLETMTGKFLQTLSGHDFAVTSLAFSQDGELLASASMDRTIKVWDTISGHLVDTLVGHTDYIHGLAFSPRTLLLASTSMDESACLWDTNSGQMLGTIRGRSDAGRCVVFSPDGKLLAFGSFDLEGLKHHVNIYDPVSGHLKIALGPHESEIFSIAFTSDAKILAVSVRVSCELTLWNPISGQLLHKVGHGYGGLTALTFSSNGQYVVAGRPLLDGAIIFCDISKGTVAHTWKSHYGKVDYMAFSADLKFLACYRKGLIQIDDMTILEKVHSIQESVKPSVQALAFSPDGHLVISASADGTIKVWTIGEAMIDSGNNLDFMAYFLLFSPDGEIVAAADHQLIRIWNVQSDRLQESKDIEVGYAVRSLCFSPCGNLLAAIVAGDRIDIWHRHSWTLLEEISFGEMLGSAVFHAGLPILETDEGSCALQESADYFAPCVPIQPQQEHFHYEDQWIGLGDDYILWLPPEYRPATHNAYDVHNDSLIIGLLNGKILFLEISSALFRSQSSRRYSHGDAFPDRQHRLFKRAKTVDL